MKYVITKKRKNNKDKIRDEQNKNISETHLKAKVENE